MSRLLFWLALAFLVVAAIRSKLREAARQVGGHATLFRASALGGHTDKVVGVNTVPDAAQARIQHALQQQFDPQGVFATGRIFPATAA